MLYSTADCAAPPAAKLQSNVFGTHYELILDPSVVPFEGPQATDAEGRPFGKCEALMDVQYKTRLKGFMRPRRCDPARSCAPASVYLSLWALKCVINSISEQPFANPLLNLLLKIPWLSSGQLLLSTL